MNYNNNEDRLRSVYLLNFILLDSPKSLQELLQHAIIILFVIE
jgi:hypothetical protein